MQIAFASSTPATATPTTPPATIPTIPPTLRPSLSPAGEVGGSGGALGGEGAAGDDGGMFADWLMKETTEVKVESELLGTS